MRMSCNGCRVLRKGCSESCTIRPCLQWIKNPESQAHATLFLAKFYGRAGLLNLLAAGPDNVRPAVFRSLLYEACGRMVNPVYGSVGLLWTGSWQLCHAAVEAVLSGAPITQVVPATDSPAANPLPPLKSYDIRHVSKDSDLHKISRARAKFKRTAKPRRGDLSRREPSQEAGSQVEVEVEGSEFSMETEEASHVSQGEPMLSRSEEEEVELDLSLGLQPMGQAGSSACRVAMPEREEMNGQDGATCQLCL